MYKCYNDTYESEWRNEYMKNTESKIKKTIIIYLIVVTSILMIGVSCDISHKDVKGTIHYIDETAAEVNFGLQAHLPEKLGIKKHDLIEYAKSHDNETVHISLVLIIKNQKICYTKDKTMLFRYKKQKQTC